MCVRIVGIVDDGVKINKLVFCLLALWLLAITNATAQNFWQQTNGPHGGEVRAFAIDSRGYIWAGTDDDGVFRSTNNGDSWTPVNTGLTSARVNALAINSSGHIFAGGDDGGGVFRSTNDGGNWVSVNTGLTNTTVWSLVINLKSGHIFAGTVGGAFRSKDNGSNWEKLDTGFIGIVESLTINSDGYIYAGTNGDGIFRSKDNGETWEQVNTGLTNKYVHSFAINSSGHIFAGTSSEVFRSTDNGDNWAQFRGVLTGGNLVQSIAISSNGYIFAGTDRGGVFRCADSSGSWTQVNTGLTRRFFDNNINVYSLIINSSGHIFAGIDDGAFRSKDKGENWSQINIGLTNTSVDALAINESGHIFAGTFGKVFRSIDNGESWRRVNNDPTLIFVQALTINSHGHIFAGTFFDGVFRSTDNGEIWTQINTGLTNSNNDNALVVNAFVINNDGHIFAGTDGGVFHSDNNGDTWTPINTGFQSVYTEIEALAINSNGNIFAGTCGDGVFRYNDGDKSWKQINIGLTNPCVRSLAINSEGHIFAGTYSPGINNNGVFRSTNDGNTWTQINIGMKNTNILSLAINVNRHIFAGTAGGGVFRSTNNGDAWMQVNTGLTNTDAQAFAIDSVGNIYLGTGGGGVFKNIDSAFPEIKHTPPLSPQPNEKDFTVDAVISDNKDIARATLNYRKGGDSSFISIALMPIGDNHYRGSIPARAMTSRGIEYHIIATDLFSNITRLPSSGIFSVRVRVSGEGEMKRDSLRNSISQPNGSEQSAYRLISVPLELDYKSPKAVLEDDLGKYNIKKWRFYEFGADQNPHEYPTTDMTPGKAFWLIVRESGKVIDSGPGTSNQTDKKYEIPLHRMWNLIGNPFNFTIPVDSLRLKSGERVELRTYTGSWNERSSNPVTAMQPFEGYAIYVNSPDTLLINPDLSTSTSSLAKVSIPNRANQLLWSIRILAQCQEARDEDNVAGVIAKVSNNWDEMNYPEPPIIGEFVSIFFPQPELGRLSESYCTDFRLESPEGYVWPLAIATNIRDKVHLTFEGLESVPEENEIWLIDEVVPIAQNLRQNQSYVVAASSPEHPKRLKLVVGKHDFVEEKIANTQIIPTTYELNQNFPNPFNPATTIRYGLPKTERVTLKIYNLLGEEVAIIMNDELRAAGYHVAIWDGRNKLGEVVGSGVYVYRFRAGSFTSIKKMALVK